MPFIEHVKGTATFASAVTPFSRLNAFWLEENKARHLNKSLIINKSLFVQIPKVQNAPCLMLHTAGLLPDLPEVI